MENVISVKHAKRYNIDIKIIFLMLFIKTVSSCFIELSENMELTIGQQKY